MRLATVVKYCDQLLNTRRIADYERAVNGLQLGSNICVKRIGAAVDINLRIVQKVVTAQANLLIVHHGLFWHDAMPITGARYEMLRLLIQHEIAVYSSHLPLDLHPKIGNNIQLARKLGLKNPKPFLYENGRPLGIQGELTITREDLVELVSRTTGSPARLIAGGLAQVRRIGIVTGAGGSKIAKAAAEGVDTFLTGEGPHWTFVLAEDLGINVIYAGHYATEAFGVKALAQLLSKKFNLPWVFIDHPSGL